MNIPIENFEPQISEPDKTENLVGKNIDTFGIGHLKEVQFNIDQIPQKEREEIIESYIECTDKVKVFLTDIKGLLDAIKVDDQQRRKIFDDLLRGIESASYRTANQILYHGKLNAKETIDAFDEFGVLLEVVHQSITEPKILEKKPYSNSTIYHLVPPSKDSVEHRKVTEVDTLFSPEHVAWNISSNSLYEDDEKVSKSGIRLDYNPLYKETNGVLDNTKTEWITSVDISGPCIDKIMNKYSPRGHHFTNLFNYKVGLLIPGLSKAITQHFDEAGKEVN